MLNSIRSLSPHSFTAGFSVAGQGICLALSFAEAHQTHGRFENLTLKPHDLGEVKESCGVLYASIISLVCILLRDNSFMRFLVR